MLRAVAAPPARAAKQGPNAAPTGKAGPLARALALSTPGVQLSGPLAETIGLQRKLAIGAVNDPLEHEADRVAEQVMRMPAGSPTTSAGAPRVQRKCASCGTCESCKAEQADEGQGTMQRKAAPRPQIGAGGSSAAATGMNAPPIVHEVLRSPGRRLDAATRAFFEPRFGSDFGDVRIHTDATAATSATAVNARAYTAGKNIVFAGGQYTPHSDAGRRLLAHELVHVVQQRNGVVSPSSIQRSPGDSAGGCGLCYGEGPGAVGPREAGTAAHKAIQAELAKQGVEPEVQWGKGRVDLAVVRPISKEVAIAEIKPLNEQGIDDGIEQIKERLRVHPRLKAYGAYKWVPLDPYYEIKKLIPFPTLAPVCHPPYRPQPRECYSQDLLVYGPVEGRLFLYSCEPSYAELKARGCGCECKEPKDEEPKKRKPKDKEPEPDTGPSGLEQLVKLGAKVAALLAADGLLSVATAFVGTLAAALSPLLALAALALGIVYLWGKIKSIVQAISSAVRWVWGKISSVLKAVWDGIKELGIKLGELAMWAGGVIKSVAEKIAAGLLWVGRKAIAGVKWIGGKIASGAEAVWDWLFGSGPEISVPNIEFPAIEEPVQHCGTVAYEDAVVKLDADLLFPFDEWKLKPEADAPLNKAAEKVVSMLGNSNDPITFEGYTDKIGTFEYNKTLSERRAGAVRDWFLQHGVIPPSKKTEIIGLGKTRAQYDDPEGRKKDRRVEIWVMKRGSSKKVCW